MPTNEERRQVVAKLREHQHGDVRYPTFEGGMIASWLRLREALGLEGDNPQEDHTSMFGYLADLIELESSVIANITFTPEQQEELFQRVMKEFYTNGYPKCGACVEEDA